MYIGGENAKREKRGKPERSARVGGATAVTRWSMSSRLTPLIIRASEIGNSADGVPMPGTLLPPR
jgi:hypothetical protein